MSGSQSGGNQSVDAVSQDAQVGRLIIGSWTEFLIERLVWLAGISTIILVGLIFYFLVIRPQSKKQREHEKMLQAVGKGDDIITAGGLHGRVTDVTDDLLTVEIGKLKGERMRVKVARGKIETVVKADTEKAEGS